MYIFVDTGYSYLCVFSCRRRLIKIFIFVSLRPFIRLSFINSTFSVNAETNQTKQHVNFISRLYKKNYQLRQDIKEEIFQTYLLGEETVKIKRFKIAQFKYYTYETKVRIVKFKTGNLILIKQQQQQKRDQ